MANLKKRRHSMICDTCKGNGYVKVIHDNNETNIHQCWVCESEGELYMDEDEIIESYIDTNNSTYEKTKLN